MINLKEFTTIESYEDCPVDTELLVWTGDSFIVEYVTTEVDYGTYYPANGVDFIAFIELPDYSTSFEYFEDYLYKLED